MIQTSDFPVAASNIEQAQAWDGTEGAYWAANAQRFEQSIDYHYRQLLAAVEAANLAPDARMLDVGCGTGRSTRDLAQRCAAGSVHGIDLSARMLAVARREATRAGVTNVSFEQADAQVRRFETQSFDAVISSTAAMFFGDKPAAFVNLARALRRNGFLALLVWNRAAANEWFTALTAALTAERTPPSPPPAGPHPFSMAAPAAVRQLLEDAGFADVDFTEVRGPMYFGTDASDAYRFVLGLFSWMLDDLEPNRREDAMAALWRTISEHSTPAGVTYAATTWVVTARRR